MKLTKKLIFLTCILLLTFSCESSKETKTKKKEIENRNYVHDNMSGYRPIEPLSYLLPIGWYDRYTDATIQYNDSIWENKFDFGRKDEGVYFSDLSDAHILNVLCNEQVGIYISDKESTVEVSYAGVGVSGKNKKYDIVMDYGKSATVPIMKFEYDENCERDFGEVFGYGKVGVGLRLTASIKALKGGLNLGDIFGLTIGGEKIKVKGTLSISILGLSGKEITTLVPMPSEINRNTIQAALVAIATVKSKIYDPLISLTPQLLSVRPLKTDSLLQLVDNPAKFFEGSDYRSNLLRTNRSLYEHAPQLFIKLK